MSRSTMSRPCPTVSKLQRLGARTAHRSSAIALTGKAASAANRAPLEQLGRELNLRTEKKEVGKPVTSITWLMRS